MLKGSSSTEPASAAPQDPLHRSRVPSSATRALLANPSITPAQRRWTRMGTPCLRATRAQWRRVVAIPCSSSESSTPAVPAVAGSQLVQCVASNSNRRRTVVRTDGVDHLVGSLQLKHLFRSVLEVVNDPNIGSLL